jgi:hypothetical protein
MRPSLMSSIHPRALGRALFSGPWFFGLENLDDPGFRGRRRRR